MIDLSIIIVSFNARDYLLNCLKSVFENSSKISLEVIVVNNASTDKSIEGVIKEFPKVKVIQNMRNLGFARANNQGIKASTGEYTLLLNSDTKISDNALSKMIAWMDKNPEASVSTCQLLNEDNSIQPTGGFFPTLLRIFAWQFFLDDIIHFNSYHPKQSFYKKERELDWVTGAFFLIRRAVIDKVGLMDENFFMYAEELEYCFRIKKAGFKVFFTPVASVIHYGFKSGSKEKALIGEYESLKYFYRKHFSPPERFLASIFLKIGALLRFALLGVLRHNKGLATTYEKCFKVA